RSWQCLGNCLGTSIQQLSSSSIRQGIPRMGEPRGSIVAGNGREDQADRFLERFMGASAQPAQDGLDLGKRLLDRRAVRGVGWQEEQVAAARREGLANALSL